MWAYIQKLIDKTDPSQGHVFITILVSIILCLATLGVAFANIWVKKDLDAELIILVGGLTTLTGYNVKKNIEATTTTILKQRTEASNTSDNS